MVVRHVTSDGRTGEQSITSLEKARYNVGDYAKQVMRSDKFVTSNCVTYKVAVIKGEEFFDNDLITSKICAEAKKRGYLTSPAEVAPLLRKQVSDEYLKVMGLWRLIVMHEPIIDSGGRSRVLGLCRDGRGRWLHACHGHANRRWPCESGFVFLAPQE